MEKYYNMVKSRWNVLTLASKVVLILWTLISLSNLVSSEIYDNFFQWIISYLLGCFIFVGIAQLISMRKKVHGNKKTLLPTDKLPVISTSNVLLSNGEICHYCGTAVFVKTKNVVVGYSGGNRGSTIRIAKGMSVRVGAHKASPIRGNVQERTEGVLSITNKRVVFSGNKGAFDKKISTLSAVTPYRNGIAFQFNDKQYPLETKEPEYVYEILARIINSSEEF